MTRHAMYVYRYTEARLRDHCLPRKSNMYYTFWVRVCSLMYPACKAHAQYYIYICGLSLPNIFFPHYLINGTIFGKKKLLYTRVNKNPSAWNFLSPKPEATCGTVAIIIRVVLLSPYLRIRAVSLSSIHCNQSHRVYTYINRRRQYVCLIWN